MDGDFGGDDDVRYGGSHGDDVEGHQTVQVCHESENDICFHILWRRTPCN